MENYPRITHKLRNHVRELQRSTKREEHRQYLAEGPNLAQEVLRCGVEVDVVVVEDGKEGAIEELASRFDSMNVQVVSASSKDMELISDAKTSQGILCVLPYHSERPLGERVIVLDDVSDPGNVGTIIRCAAWFGFTDVVLSKQSADIYNPKTVRSTAGAAFHVNVIRKKEITQWLESLDERPVVATVPRGGQELEVLSTLGRMALVIGSEAHGISAPVLEKCSHLVSIPGKDTAESLNAATAAAIVCYEARRL